MGEKMDKIIFRTDTNVVTAFMEMKSDVCGCGDSLISAIGRMVWEHPDYFLVYISQEAFANPDAKMPVDDSIPPCSTPNL